MATEEVSSPLDDINPGEEQVQNGEANVVNGDLEEDEDDVQTGSRRQKAGDGVGAQQEDEEADDLFGDEDGSDLDNTNDAG